jgi:nicotinamide phosphoribosyltransferase
MKYNLIMDTDSYKASHWLQYPPQTTAMYSYLESRGGRYPATVFFGLQYILKEYLSQPVEMWMVEEAEAFFTAHGLSFNSEGWRYIVNDLGGKLPIRIKAVPEGTVVPVKQIMMSIESTDPQTFWLVSWLETLLLRVWYPITVATQSYYLKQIIWDALQVTADDPGAEIPFKLHDFGSRGVSSSESAAIGGMSHLVNFMGSDTVVGIRAANHYYQHPMAAFSIPAAEHSTITSWQRDGELAAYQNMLDQFAKPGAILAVVSDSYNLWEAIDHLWGDKLKQQIIDSGATVVIRPDSGDPVSVVSEVLQRLDQRFGSTMNSKGYKVLNYVRVIQGDGINAQSLAAILKASQDLGFSASNIAFGMGGALLQQIDRDTQKFAVKCSEVTINGQNIPVYKDPATDPGKRSKQGRLALVQTAAGHQTVPATAEVVDLLVTVYENGQILQEYNLTEIRERTNLHTAVNKSDKLPE